MTATEEEILAGLHQLLKNVEPSIKSSPDAVDVAEDTILHLEETDENFHKYDLVKHIRQCLEKELGSLVDEEIEKMSISGGTHSVTHQETLVQAVTKKTTDSQIFSDLSQDLHAVTSSAVSTLLKSLEEEQNSTLSDEDTESQISKRMKSVFSEGASSFGSSFNQGMFFMSQEQFHCIAEELDSRQPLNIRREALIRLCQVPPSDVMASESWAQLRVSLIDALADSDAYISHTALSFHAKMFAVSNSHIMRSTYTCLAEHLLRRFKSTSHLPLLSEPLDITEPFVVQTLKRVRLANEFQREVPLIWVRYPENFLEVVIDSTLSLLTGHMKTAGKDSTRERVSVLHFLSLVDTKAHWFRRWLHSNYSRATVIKRIEEKYRLLVVESVQQCLLFCQDCVGRNHTLPRHSTDKVERRTTYMPNEVRYAYFCHSLSLIAQILHYSGGRNLFPLTISSKTLSIQHLLVSWIKLLNYAKYKPKPGHKIYESAALVGKALCSLCMSNAFVKSCISSEVISALLQPIKSWLGDSNPRASEMTMLHTSEILAALASTCSGRKLLMETKEKDKKQSAAHTIAEFAQKALSGKLPYDPQSSGRAVPSYQVVCAYVFICRQIYSTCEGLLLLDKYQLHSNIALAWRQAYDRRNDNQRPGDEMDSVDCDAQSSPTQASSQNLHVWKENLLDNLLNFAATPKGLLLLQQTGAIDECVKYMHSRYTKKLQVSKCEKFGYGVMVTQVAATAPGIAALRKAGYLRSIVGELWVTLEHATDEIRMTAPRPNPLYPIDRSCHKSFTGLVNVLSSYAAVHEIFAGQALPNKASYPWRLTPQSPLDLVDRLVVINSNAKLHALFNCEQSLAFGLRLMSIMACSLDSWLLLETQYNIQQTLMELQKNNSTYEGELIIDQLSIERNHLLVRALTIGGEGERKLPPTMLQASLSTNNVREKNLYVWPLFHHLPIPREYTPTTPAPSSMKKDSPLSRFLMKTKSVDKNRQWLEQLQSTFVKLMTTQPGAFRGGIIPEVLEKVIHAQERMPEKRIFKRKTTLSKTSKESSNFAASPVVTAGVKMSVWYGKHVNALKANMETAVNNLTSVIKSCTQLLNQQQVYSTTLKLISKPYPCHDWFASSVFLIMSGNKDRTSSFLTKLSEYFVSGYVWPARLHASIHLPEALRMSGIPAIYACTGHNVELIVQAELSSVYSAFRMSGYTPSQIVQHWLSQCFWNYMTWPQIVHYISTVIIMGADYQVYLCVSVLKHLRQKILVHRQCQDLQVFLKENALEGFVVAEWLPQMVQLERKYRSVVLSDMRNMVHHG
ncbi:protein broad-minded-like [Clavelina lepadiformis]|uniref:protein broad-minded-like n=1 Tax=Clavelina lepadiformis TaxID=159417 RepID=UPI0040429C16